MELTKMEQYKLRKTADMPNIKDIIGERVKCVAEHMGEYIDADGEVHRVLSVKLADGRYYRTEVAAFIDNYKEFSEVFDNIDERPDIEIVGKKSKRGNPFVNFVVVGE